MTAPKYQIQVYLDHTKQKEKLLERQAPFQPITSQSCETQLFKYYSQPYLYNLLKTK